MSSTNTLNAAVQYIVPQTGIPGEVSLRGAGRYYSRTYSFRSGSDVYSHIGEGRVIGLRGGMSF